MEIIGNRDEFTCQIKKGLIGDFDSLKKGVVQGDIISCKRLLDLLHLPLHNENILKTFRESYKNLPKIRKEDDVKADIFMGSYDEMLQRVVHSQKQFTKTYRPKKVKSYFTALLNLVMEHGKIRYGFYYVHDSGRKVLIYGKNLVMTDDEKSQTLDTLCSGLIDLINRALGLLSEDIGENINKFNVMKFSGVVGIDISDIKQILSIFNIIDGNEANVSCIRVLSDKLKSHEIVQVGIRWKVIIDHRIVSTVICHCSSHDKCDVRTRLLARLTDRIVQLILNYGLLGKRYFANGNIIHFKKESAEATISRKLGNQCMVNMAGVKFQSGSSIDTSIIRSLIRSAHGLPQRICPCGQLAIKLKKCEDCKKAFYCSRECQRADWSKHRQQCENFAKVYTRECFQCGVLRGITDSFTNEVDIICRPCWEIDPSQFRYRLEVI